MGNDLDGFLSADMNRKKYVFVPAWVFEDEKTRELLSASENVIFVPDYKERDDKNDVRPIRTPLR